MKLSKNALIFAFFSSEGQKLTLYIFSNLRYKRNAYRELEAARRVERRGPGMSRFIFPVRQIEKIIKKRIDEHFFNGRSKS